MIADALAYVDEKPGLARSVAALRRLDALPEELVEALTVVILRDLALEPGQPLLRVAAYRAGIRLRVAYGGYEPWSAENAELLGREQPDAVFVALGTEAQIPSVTEAVRAHTSAPVFSHHVAAVDVPTLQALASAQARQLATLRGPRAKCVVVDCDDTLWAGTVGEVGVTGLAVEPRHRALQQELRGLRERGVVLAIASKNEEADVLAALRERPDVLLSEEDFVTLRVDWRDKATTVTEIATELNLGLEHVVFLDDNPVECGWVRDQLPEVRVIEFPADLHGGTLDDLGLFAVAAVTEEDRARTERYRAEHQRRSYRTGAASIEDYLRSLGTVATVGVAGPEHVARIAQLTQRTNQFNLTTRRYDEAAISALVADPGTTVLWLALRDRFGELGVIGCAIVRHGAVAELDTLLLSCRVVGRGAERVLVHHAASHAAAAGATQLKGSYSPTERNGQVADLYPRLGFRGDGPWRWDLERGLPEIPDWIEVEG